MLRVGLYLVYIDWHLCCKSLSVLLACDFVCTTYSLYEAFAIYFYTQPYDAVLSLVVS